MTTIERLVEILREAERARGRPGIASATALQCTALGLSPQDTTVILRYLRLVDEKGIPIGAS